MKVLDCFSGIGGFSLGLERAGMETIAFCEIEPFCQKVLRKHWPNVTIHDDITKLDGKQYVGTVDLICGGYPCQPFSVAGKQKGSNDARHLWPEMFRIIKEVRPSWVIAENVEGHVKLGLDTVLNDLESEGYTCWPFIIPACAVGAPHQRNRIWIIANAASFQGGGICGGGIQPNITSSLNANTKHAGQLATTQPGGKGEAVQHDKKRSNSASKLAGVGESDYVANPKCERTQRQWQEPVQRFTEFSWCENIRSVEDLRNRQDIPEPLICRGDDGFSKRVDRLKSLGNAVVPQIPELIGKCIMEIQQKDTI